MPLIRSCRFWRKAARWPSKTPKRWRAALQIWRSNPSLAIERYERARRPRAVRMQRASRRNGQIYHLPKPQSLARDLTLGAIPGRRIMARYDWIYG